MMQIKKNKPMNNRRFKGMSAILRFRDALIPPHRVLNEVELRPGTQILDFGCGPGSFSVAAAQLVGESGKVFALDIHPLAIEKVQKLASEIGLTNIKTVLSDCKTGLPNESIDVILLYHAFHDFKDPNSVLSELHRVLKVDGVLSFRDFIIKKFSSRILDTGLFKLQKKSKKTYTFSKVS